MNQLLVEHIPFKVDRLLVEQSIKENRPLVVKGILQKAGTQNQNGRIYERKILEREVNKYIDGPIKENRALGELDHPDSSVVNLQNASHNVLEMHFNGNDLVGTVEVLGTPSGNILKELFKSGIKLGISSRGLGSVETIGEGGAQEVQPDFELIAFDFVSNPSTHGAFLSPMNESVDKTQQYEQRPDCGIWCRTEQLIHDIITEK